MPQSPSRRAIYLAIEFHVLAPPALCLAYWAINDEFPLLGLALLFTGVYLAAAQGVLWASALTLGRLTWVRWLIYSVLATFVLTAHNAFGLALLNGLPHFQELALSFSIAGVPFLAGLALFIIVRRFGWRWCDATVPPGPPFRFSLAQLLLATAGVAAVLSLARVLRANIEPLKEYFATFEVLDGAPLVILTCVIGSFFTASSLGFIGVAGPRPRFAIASAALCSAAGAGYLLCYVVSEGDEFDGVPAYAIMLFTTELAAVVSGTLLFLRWGGWRIDRVEQGNVEPAPSAADSPDDVNAVIEPRHDAAVTPLS